MWGVRMMFTHQSLPCTRRYCSLHVFVWIGIVHSRTMYVERLTLFFILHVHEVYSHCCSRIKEARVGYLVNMLGLQKCLDTVIGNEFLRGVSGGERKRVSIGVEIVNLPQVGETIILYIFRLNIMFLWVIQ